MDPEAVERVEAELDSFIERRARQAKDVAKVEELWAESEARERAVGERRIGLFGSSFIVASPTLTRGSPLSTRLRSRPSSSNQSKRKKEI